MSNIRTYVTLLVLLLPQVLISLKIWHLELLMPAEGIQHLFGSVVSLVLVVLLWHLLLSVLPRVLAVPLNVVFVAGYLFMQAYHWVRHEPLSFLMLYKNGGTLLSPESVELVYRSIGLLGWLLLVTLVILLTLVHRRFDVFGSFCRFQRKGLSLVVLLSANLALSFAMPTVGNEYYEFARSAYRYVQGEMVDSADLPLYPYLKEVDPDLAQRIADDRSRPHVFIVMLESFSAMYMDRIENGKRVTPFLDELADQGLFVEHFFSASVETSKGQFATLCSVYPSYRYNVFTHYVDNDFRCLSDILSENGYVNVFMKAFNNLRFENTGNFVAANGFDYAHGMDKNFVTAAERQEYKFGWGIQDNIFYRKTFDYLDELQAKHGPDKRFFVNTMSVTNHMMFDDIPLDQRFIYPDANSHHENYSNSMYLTDQYLREFFHQLEQRDYLENSLVLILGDNGFPMGQHRNFHNTKTGYNELFKTPLLILWGDKLAPGRLSERAYSQVDVAPTILDLLDIKTTHHFVGQSIFKIDDERHFVPLVQPFDGTWLASIRYPFKLMHHKKTGREFLFNLEDDPEEQNNLLESTGVWNLELAQLKRDIHTLEINEILLEENRIYPGEMTAGYRVRVDEDRLPGVQPLAFEVIGEPNPEDQVHITVTSINPSAGGRRTVSKPVAANSGRIPRALLSPGTNTVRLLVRAGTKTVQTIDQDVYVDDGQTILLSDTEPAGSQGWGKLGLNRSVGGRELTINKRRFSFGFGAHAPSTYRVPLNGEFTYFSTGFGLDDGSKCGDGAFFEVWADDRQLLDSGEMKSRQFRQAVFNVQGYNELVLITRPGKSRDCDHTNWVNPVLHRSS